MEIAIIWFLSYIAMGEEVKANQAMLLEQEAAIIVLMDEVDRLDTVQLKLAASHAAHSANAKVTFENQQKAIAGLQERVAGHDHKHN